MNAEIKQRLRDTKFVVEASSSEQQFLWEHYCKEAMYSIPQRNKYDWKQLNPGWSETVGHISGRPIVVGINWAEVNGVLVMFWEGISQLVDYAMIDYWIRSVCSPTWDKGTRLAHTDAMNFHHVLSYIREGK